MSEAKSNKFMLGVATVMIGPRAELYDLNPDTHSVGLVKNFTSEASKSRTDLTGGRTNEIIFTMTTGSTTRATFEMYEYTAKNMSYALGLSGASLVPTTGDPWVLTAVSTGTAGAFTLVATVPATLQTIVNGGFVMVRQPSNNNILLAKVVDATGQSTGDIDIQLDPSFTGSLAIGTVISAVNVLEIGSTEGDTDLACKVSGQLADGTWVTLLYPKIRITSGLNLSFSTDNFNNIPFEFTPLKLFAGEDFYADFSGHSAKLLLDTVKSALV